MQRFRNIRRLIISACMLFTGAAFAAPPTTLPALPSVEIPKAGVLPAMDASVADPAWFASATLELSHVAIGSSPAHPAPQPTRVQLLWSPQFLFVRFLCVDHDIFLPVAGRDAKLFQGDVAEVFLDPVGDGRQYVELQVNANNDLMDQLFLCTAPIEVEPLGNLKESFIRRNQFEFLSWNFIGIKTAASKTTLADGSPGWIVDIALPAGDVLKRLDLSKFQPMTLHANFIRYDQITLPNLPANRELQSINWSPALLGRPHRSPSRFGTLILIDSPKP